MRTAHLIMAYKDPKQLERLIGALAYEGADFYVHLDKKINIDNFIYLAQLPNVRFTKNRFLINWAGYSFVNAVLEGMREITSSSTTYDFVNVMSAQEYPIKPIDQLYNHLNSHKERIFLSCEKFGSAWWQTGIERIERYSLADLNLISKRYSQALVNIIMPIRKFNFPYTLYGGGSATWWTLSGNCAKYVVNFVDNNLKFKRFFHYVWAPDEIMIPTIIMNSPFKEKVINNNLRYIDWSQGGTNPKILTTDDFEKLKLSDRFIARKFDIKVDTEILDKLDAII